MSSTHRASNPRRAPLPPAPDEANLHEAAMAYLARQSASVKGVQRVLARRVATWARRAAAELDAVQIAATLEGTEAAIERVLQRLREARVLDDATFAEARARRLSGSGKSRRAIQAHLASKGVSQEVARDALPDSPAAELQAAVRFARKRRIGPFAREEEDRAARQKALGAMARAGFDRSTCERALGLDAEEAERVLDGQRDW